MTAIEKLMVNDEQVAKKVVDVLSLFRGEDQAFFQKVMKATKYYALRHSKLEFEHAVQDIKSLSGGEVRTHI